jgi:hypothetical protein
MIQTNRRTARSPEWSAHVALVMLLIAIATNVVVGLTLKAKLDQLSTPGSSRIGEAINEIRGVDESGVQRVIDLRGQKPTLLYVSRRGCKWCDSNVRNVAALGLQASTRYRIVELSPNGVGPTGPKAFGIERLAIEEEELRRLGVTGTPYTLLVSPEGRIVDVWVGAFGKSNAPRINKALDVELPGIIP